MILVTLLLLHFAILAYLGPNHIWVISSLIYFFEYDLLQKLVWKNLLLKIWPFTQSLCWKFAKIFSSWNQEKGILLGWKILQCWEQSGYIVWGQWNTLQSNRGRSYRLWFKRMPGCMGSWLWVPSFFVGLGYSKWNGYSVYGLLECSWDLSTWKVPMNVITFVSFSGTSELESFQFISLQ